jgi:uncharacterized protein
MPGRKRGLRQTIIAVMAKQPQVGKTKTRLCPPLSPAQAAALYEALMLDSLALAGGVAGVDLAVAITPPQSRDYFETAAPANALLLPVDGRDIGECLAKTLAQLLGMGYRKVLALNSDGPSLPPACLVQAIDCLEEHDVVLGPNYDGGYYLVGMKKPHLSLFIDIAWSTDRVFTQTLERAADAGLRLAQTPAWYDIDTPDDLQRLLAELPCLGEDRLVHTRSYLADFELPAGG